MMKKEIETKFERVKKYLAEKNPDGIVLASRIYIRTLLRILIMEVEMRTINVTKARADLYNLLIQASESHEPIQITGKNTNAVLVSEEDWRAIQETLYLSTIPGMRESIIDGLETDISDAEELDW